MDKKHYEHGLTLCKALLVLFLLCVPMQRSWAQVSFSTQRAKLETVIKQLKDKSKYRFFYNDALAKVEVNAVQAKNESLKSILDKLFAGTGISYRIVDNVVYLSKDGKNAAQKPQQKKTVAPHVVEGTVTDASGEPLIGVSVQVKGTSQGTVTDLDGRYSFTTEEANPTLVFSYIGYSTQQVEQKQRGKIDVMMKEESHTLNDVVVTALGIKRSEKALSYNVQKLGGDNVNTVKNANFMNSLSGKVAGVNINASSAGMGGATRVVMRGPKSITQSNQALFVIDGIPVTDRSQGEITGGRYSSQPGSEGIADVNPEDIESISVLSGPAAAALYGSAAAQGVIMITTKKGKEGKVSVTISNSTQFSRPFIMPEFQTSYVNRSNEVMSWGDKKASQFGTYNPKDFFNTGTNIQNNVSLTTGTDKNQTYISLGTTNAKGLIPNNAYNRYNFTFRNTTSFLNDKMTLDFGFNYILENDRNMTAQGEYFNPLTAVYLFPRGESFDAVRTFELWDPNRKLYKQNWNFGDALSMQNPYWVAKRMVRTNKKGRYMVNGSLKYQLADWIDLTGRLRWDDAATKQEDKRYASTINLFAHSDYGYYGYDKINDQNLYGDLMANVNKTWETFSIGANIGGSFSRTKYDVTGFQGGLKAPSNVFSPNAIDYSQVTNDNRPIFDLNKHYINSLFANVELGWRSMLYMTLTGRNDWDSALHGTAHSSFFYPSVGMSAVISQMVKLPKFINYMKVRGSWASVGSAIKPNISSMWRYKYNPSSGTYGTVTYKFPDTFYPERTDSWEAGLTARFFDNALTLDVTLYHSNTRKQTFLRSIPTAQGYDHEYIQTGNVRNRGIELSLGYNKAWGAFEWNTTFTYSANQNKIIQLLDDPKETLNMGGLNGIDLILRKGGTMGDVYTTTDFKYDADGNIALDKTGNVMQRTLTNPVYRGSVLPKGNLGFSNEFSYKGVTLGFLLTARLGGIVMSQTQAYLDQFGVSKASAKARDNGGIAVNSGKVDAEGYYAVVGGGNPIWSEYIYSATNARLQEAHLSYTLPKSLLKTVRVTLGLTAHNLFMLYKKAPFDPESTASTGTYYQGFDYFMQPSLRSLGFNVNVKF